MSIQRVPLPLGGGINVHDDPTATPDGQWQRLRNLAPRKNGVLGQRPSLSFVREVEPSWWHWDARTRLGSAGIASPVTAYYQWASSLRPIKFLFDPNFGDITMVAITTASLDVQAETGPATETNVNVPEGTMLVITLPGVIVDNGATPVLRCGILGPATRAPTLFVFNGVTYAFNGADNGKHIAVGSDGATPVSFSYFDNDFGLGNTTFAPDGGCVVRDRVVYFKGPNLYFSDRNEPLTVGYTGITDATGNIIPSTANPAVGTNYPAFGTRDIFLGGEELENITAVAEVNTTADGSPVQSVVMAFTSSHAYMLLGEPLETTEGADILGSLQINRLNVQAGCISQDTITRTPYGTFWVGMDDVWFMPFGSMPIRVGTSIRQYIENQPKGVLWRIHAEYSDGFYRVSLFADGQGPQQYDPCGMQLWLSLKGGPPRDAASAQWFGPQVFVQTDAPTFGGGSGGQPGVFCMARDTRAQGDGKLYALQRFSIFGGDLPAIWGMSLCGFDSFDGRDTTAPQAEVSVWQPLTGYAAGDTMVPTPYTGAVAPILRAPIYVCTTTGTSGVAAPDWTAANATAAGTLADGSVVWTLRYHNGAYPMNGYDVNLTQGNNQIEWSMLSKENMLGDPMAEKLLDGAELGYATSNRTQLTYNSHPKQDSRSRVLGFDAQQTADNVANQTTGDRVWQRKLLTPAPTKRFHGLSATFECEQDAGIVITAGVNDTIQIALVTEVEATYTIAAGYYADLGAVLTAITAQVPLQSTYGVDGGFSRALVGFRGLQPIYISVNTGSRLAQLLGFSPRQGTSVISLLGDWFYGYESPRAKVAPDMQLSGLNLRFKMFGRRPQ